MSTGKRFDDKKNKNNTTFKEILILILIILIIGLITSFTIFYITPYFKNKNIDTDTPATSTIEITKKIVGLEDIEITKMNIESSSSSSLIEISFKNISDNIIDNCEISLYLLDENESVIFGTSLNLPNMNPNSSETFSVLCSDNITNVADYKVVLDK